MTIINVMVDDQRLEFSSMPVVASEGVKETYVKFALSSDWSGFGATALFYRDDSPEDVYTSVLDGAGLAEVPYEITAAPGWIRFGLSGSDGTSVHTSEILKYKVVKGKYTSGQSSEPPAPGIYEQMLAIAGQMRDTLNAAVIEQNAIIQGLVTDMDDLRSDMETEQTTFESVVTGQINTLVNNFAGSSRETILFEGSHTVNIGDEIDLVSDPTVYDYLDIVLNDGMVGTIIGPIQNSQWRVTGETVKSTGTSVTTYVIEGVLDAQSLCLRVSTACAIVDTGTASTRYDLGSGPIADESLRRYCLKVIGRKLTDDAEVLNIRVGADGVTYQTAGTAVRSQLDKKLNAPISGGTVDYGTSGQLLATDGQGNTEWVDSVIPDGSITVAKLAPGVIDTTYQIQGAAASSVTVGQSLASKANAADVTALDTRLTSAIESKADASDIDGLDQRVTALEESGGGGGGITSAVKNALLALFRNVVYAGANGQALYDDLYDAFYDVTAIRLDNYSLVFTTTGDTAQITATTVPAGGTVTWASSDTSVATVDQTGLVTSVGYGSAVITATSGSASASCSITVSQVTLLSISANYTQSGRVYPSTALDSLKSDLAVTASWSDGTTSTVAGSNYVLSGTLTAGTRQVTVSYGGKTATFNVVVSPVYTVSNNLTHCTTNNDAASIGEGQAYRATITADKGYQLDTATIMMGGTDVTSTVYNAGVINIASVTGNIVITVATSEDMTGVLHFVDFTQSLVDQVTGDTVTPCANSKYSSTPPTRDSNGLSFTGIAQYVPIAQVTFPCTIEMKVGTCAITSTSTNNRLIMLGAAFDTDGVSNTYANGKGPFIYHASGSNRWAPYNGGWGDYTTRITARDAIADSIIKIYIDANGMPHLTVNGVSYGNANTSFLSTPYLQLGTASNSDGVANMTVEHIKVYDGEV